MKIEKLSAMRVLVMMVLCVATLRAHAATNVFVVGSSGLSAYVLNGVSNPDLALVRGFTYTFQVGTPGHPFWIKTVQGNGTLNGYNDGVTGNGTASGTVTFSVPSNAPPLLFYNCQFHSLMTGRFNIEDSPNVRITGITTGDNLVLTSTGTDALNVRVETRPSLSSGLWTPMSLIGNSYAGGTNVSETAAPVGKAFFRVVQSL